MAGKTKKQKSPQKKKSSTPIPIMTLRDRWEALARNKQYSKDYAVRYRKERTPIDDFLSDEVNEIDKRMKGAGIQVAPTPTSIPEILTNARKSVREKSEKVNLNGTKEEIQKRRHKLELERMEKELPGGVFTCFSDAVKLVSYGKRTTQLDPARYVFLDFFRDRRFVQLEIDLTIDPLETLMDRIREFITTLRKSIKHKQSHLQTFPKYDLDHWEIYDRVEAGETPRNIARNRVNSTTPESPLCDQDLNLVYKRIDDAYKKAKAMVASIYPDD